MKIVARGGNYYRHAAQHLFFERGGVLYAQPFNLQTLETEGAAFAIADNLARVSADGHVLYDVSEAGVLAYQKGVDGEPKQTLWVDREGNASPTVSGTGLFTSPTLSSDDRFLALAVPVENSGYQIHVHDLDGGTRTEITQSGDNLSPVFTPDGKTVIYISSQASPPFLLHDQIPCGKLFLIDDTPFCHFHPVKRFVDAAFPVEPGVAAVFYVSAVNSAGESDLSNGVGIVLAQTIMLVGG